MTYKNTADDGDQMRQFNSRAMVAKIDRRRFSAQLVLFGILVLTAHLACADYISGLDAYLRGDENLAVQEFRQAIEKDKTDDYAIAIRALRDAHLKRNYSLKVSARNQIESIRLLGRAAEQTGFAETLFQLYELASQHQMSEANTFLHGAAALGHPVAQYRVATDARTSFDEGVKWLRKSAESGYAPAQFNLASLLTNSADLHGKSLLRNDTEAAQLYIQISSNDADRVDSNLLARAKGRLARMYLEGRGVDRNVRRAHRLALESAALGGTDGPSVLRDMHRDGTLTSISDDAFQAWRSRAVRVTP